jgi:hypothetical protein
MVGMEPSSNPPTCLSVSSMFLLDKDPPGVYWEPTILAFGKRSCQWNDMIHEAWVGVLRPRIEHCSEMLQLSALTSDSMALRSRFPVSIRLAYVWAIASAALAIWAAASPTMPAGIWGAPRHALTVGFLAMMVFAISQRILPAFSGMRLLFSTKLMFTALLLLTLGCFSPR